ncbi:hypothetical protein ACET3Z_012920 [Daucus carota]
MSVNNAALSKPRKPPVLIMPVQDDYNQQCDLYNVSGLKISQANSRGKSDQSSRCVGSSKGWLILDHSDQTNEGSLSIFSPLSGNVRKIVLPSCARPSGFCTRWISKAVLTLSPGSPGEKYGVVFLYGVCDYKVAFLSTCGDQDEGNKWIDLKSSGGSYSDVLSNQDSVFALLTSGFVDVWDLRPGTEGGFVKNLRIETKSLDRVVELEPNLRDLYTSNSYLVESKGNLLLVIRITGEFVRENGEVVNEGALLDDEVYSHLVLPYKTKNFYVHKLDMRLRKWVRIDSLDDQALFLGLNESVSFAASDIPECRGNSIYFTDDHWDHINIHEHDLYGGHDMGIFSLSDKNVEEIFEIRRMVPPPVWIDQNVSAV